MFTHRSTEILKNKIKIFLHSIPHFSHTLARRLQVPVSLIMLLYSLLMKSAFEDQTLSEDDIDVYVSDPIVLTSNEVEFSIKSSSKLNGWKRIPGVNPVKASCSYEQCNNNKSLICSCVICTKFNVLHLLESPVLFQECSLGLVQRILPDV